MMLDRVMSLVTVAAFLCPWLGCKRADYYPLRQGQTWEYESRWIEHRPGLDSTSLLSRSTLRLMKQVRLESGQKGWLLEARTRYPFDTSYVLVDTSYLVRSPSHILQYRTRAVSHADTLFVTAPRRGLSWSRPLSWDKSIRIALVGQEDITTRGGTWHKAWKAAETVAATGQYGHCWFAPGVGLVKDEFLTIRDDSTIITTVLELTSYNPK